ncbi:unnamed protein product [Didymodactylos carnosus]|uniref:Uncharacterized protein n=1 Tax=Didymodactylos carnosus TaxID=1234261 RepID=A0A815C1C4_9BILA|nr:unnamed protein product [Didymodactylos carnosus]CAF1277520.1 unnamed protein product [Didymodactylos carnosus]CAF3950040.1 unnamed protein product [Didymodactylos carnosus]CAF4070376.1 unnamed protein product [Didymodactylos carnosus]
MASHRNRNAWKKVQGLLAGGVNKSIDQIKTRHRTIKQSYTKCTDNNKRTGAARKTTKYFQDAEELFSGKDPRSDENIERMYDEPFTQETVEQSSPTTPSPSILQQTRNDSSSPREVESISSSSPISTRLKRENNAEASTIKTTKKKKLSPGEKFLNGYSQIQLQLEERRMKFEFEMEAKRLEEETKRRKQDQ